MRYIKYVILFLVVISGYFFFVIRGISHIEEKPYTFMAEEENSLVNEITIYGTSLNIKGNLTLNDTSNIKDVKLILINQDMIEMPTYYGVDGNEVRYYLSTLINDGYNLEGIPEKKLYLFLRVVDNDDNEKYYALKNNTNYPETTYYSLSTTKKKTVISDDSIYKTIMFNTSKYDDDKIYDITIDAGHGGVDSGAINGSEYEKTHTLIISKLVRDKLTALGLRVKMTRETDVFLDNYDHDDSTGRATIAKSTNSKYIFSIHLNSNVYSRIHGVEVYTSDNINYDLAKNIADNIVNNVPSSYSNNMAFKIYNGVYSKTFTNDDIIESNETAAKRGIQPYNISTDACYYYIIRESGGVLTGAYIDGRDSKTGNNPYINTNVGVEGYLIEIGYLSNDEEFEKIKNNADKYASAIVDAIKEKLGL